MRLQTRSGTNEFHGALFYGTNNSALNANTFFQNLNGQEKNWTNRNQFGGRIGGPIIRNKAFFFVLIDEQRYKTRANVTGEVWTQQALAGNFRYWPGVENDHALGGANASVDRNGNPIPARGRDRTATELPPIQRRPEPAPRDRPKQQCIHQGNVPPDARRQQFHRR